MFVVFVVVIAFTGLGSHHGRTTSAFVLRDRNPNLLRTFRTNKVRIRDNHPIDPLPTSSSSSSSTKIGRSATREDDNGSGIRKSEEDESLVSSIVDSVTVSTLDDEVLSLSQVLPTNDDDGRPPVVLSCLSHFGDFNAWELTQQYVTALQEGGQLADSDCQIILVGIGSVKSARQFAQDLELGRFSHRLTLVADPTGQVSDTLGCYRGWLAVDPIHRQRYPQTDMNPLFKLLGMIFGMGSPGTIEEVLYGYTGDVTSKKGVDGRNWVVQSLLQGSNKGRFPSLTAQAFENTPIQSSLRPFELATLRLQTGLHIVKNWRKLGAEGDLVTRMGGTFVLDSTLGCKWSYFDQGILTYADIDRICEVLQAISLGEEYIPWTKEQRSILNKQREEEFVQRQRELSLAAIEMKKLEDTIVAAPQENKVGASPFFAQSLKYVDETNLLTDIPTNSTSESFVELTPNEEAIVQELGGEIVQETDEEIVQELAEKMVEEIIQELDKEVIEELDEEMVQDIDEEVIVPELEVKIVQELDEEVIPEPDEEVMEDLDEEIVQELDEEVTEELDEEIVEELDEEVTEELDDEIVQELDEEVTEELDDEIVQELDEEVIKEVDNEIVQELDEQVVEETIPGPDEEITEDLDEEIVQELEKQVIEETIPELDEEVIEELDDEVVEGGIVQEIEEEIVLELDEESVKETDGIDLDGAIVQEIDEESVVETDGIELDEAVVKEIDEESVVEMDRMDTDEDPPQDPPVDAD